MASVVDQRVKTGVEGGALNYETSLCLQKMPCYERFTLTSVALQMHFWNVDDCLRKLGLPGWVGATGVGDISA